MPFGDSPAPPCSAAAHAAAHAALASISNDAASVQLTADGARSAPATVTFTTHATPPAAAGGSGVNRAATSASPAPPVVALPHASSPHHDAGAGVTVDEALVVAVAVGSEVEGGDATFVPATAAVIDVDGAAVLDGVGVAVSDADADALAALDGVVEVVPLVVPVPVAGGEAGTTLADADDAGLADTDGTPIAEPVEVGVVEPVRVGNGVSEPVGVSVNNPEVSVDEPVGVSEGVDDAVTVTVADGGTLVPLGVPSAEREPVDDAVTDAVQLTDTVAASERLPETVALGVAEPVPVPVAVALVVTRLVPVPTADNVAVPEFVAVAVAADVAVADAVVVAVCVSAAVEDALPEGLLGAEGAAELDAVAVGVLGSDGEPLTVTAADAVSVDVKCGLRDAVPDGDCVSGAVPSGVTVALLLGVAGDVDDDVAVAAPVADTVPDAVGDEVVAPEGVCGGLRVKIADAVAVALRVAATLRDADGDGPGVPLAELDCVTPALGVAVLVAARDGDVVPVALGVGVLGPLGGRLGVAVLERLPVSDAVVVHVPVAVCVTPAVAEPVVLDVAVCDADAGGERDNGGVRVTDGDVVAVPVGVLPLLVVDVCDDDGVSVPVVVIVDALDAV